MSWMKLYFGTTTARATELWKKYTDKICDQILKAKNAQGAEMFLKNQNTGWILFASAKMD